MRKTLLSLSVFTCVMPLSAAVADGPPYVNSATVPRTIAFKLYKDQMIALRNEALTAQAKEGGMLSPASRTKFQRRIDHIERVYKRRLQDGEFAA